MQYCRFCEIPTTQNLLCVAEFRSDETSDLVRWLEACVEGWVGSLFVCERASILGWGGGARAGCGFWYIIVFFSSFCYRCCCSWMMICIELPSYHLVPIHNRRFSFSLGLLQKRIFRFVFLFVSTLILFTHVLDFNNSLI